MKDELCVWEGGMKRLHFKSSPARDVFEKMERELIPVFDDVLHSDYRNPERIECPGTGVLKKLVISPKKFAFESTLRHLGRCAPCVDDLKKLRLKVKRRRIDSSR
jgi:hypothetical protein